MAAQRGERRAAVLLAACCLLACAWPLWSPAASTAAGQSAVIGRSVQGRAIVSVRSGGTDAAVRVLVVGSIHGDETAGMRVARRLVASGAPPRVELLVVPTVNPDGVAAGTRGNARGVDLNRNFPVAWRPLGGLEYSGRHPLSEPESRSARRLILRTRPDLTIWFHQPFGIVDRSGGDPLVERRYAQLSGLPLVRLRRYPGSATRWQNRAFPASSAFVVELPARVEAPLVERAARAVRALARELASPDVGDSAEAGR